MSDLRIAIIGAGNVGGNLGQRLVKSGYSVRFGVRNPASAAGVETVSISDAASWANVIFLALPGPAVVDVARSLGKNLDGKVVVDCANSVGRSPDGPTLAQVPEGSLTAAIAKAVPGAQVVKAFNTFGAEFHLDPMISGAGVDVFMAGDSADAKATVATIAKQAGFTPVDAGPLRNAALLENLAILWIHLAMKGGQGRHVAFKLQRRE